jgi:dipeptidyl aminopeptidase/acylaminoacyl peptidase
MTCFAGGRAGRTEDRDELLGARVTLGIRGRLWAGPVGMLLVGALVLPPPLAQAAFPGANGRIAFASDRDGNVEVYVMNADGTAQTNVTDNPADDSDPAWSPDGTRIAFTSNRDGNNEIYVMNADGSGQTRLTVNAADDFAPAWSPDGTMIGFNTDRDGNFEVYVMNADGSAPTNLSSNPADEFEPAWSPDGTRIAFGTDRDANNEVYVMNADGSAPTNLTNSSASDVAPAWSPDGTRIAFQGDPGGNREILVMNADGSGQTSLTDDDDLRPTWSPDGTMIAFYTFRDGNREIYVMNADGSSETNLTNHPAVDRDPDWQPLRFPKKVRLKAKPKSVDRGERIRLRAKVSPCEGHERDKVEFFRKRKRIATKKSNDNCVATLRVRMKKTSRFRALSPRQDADHLAGRSRTVKVTVRQV